MNQQLKAKIEATQMQERPDFGVGDEISVHNVIREGEKSRVQIFRGIVLARRGEGLSETFTVRKISDGIGVEKIFPLHSPNVKDITINKRGKVRQSKIYYMRDRIGRSAMKIKSADSKSK
ncbi:MAG: 50S ribosomal protein L19 [Candidatus Dojkabacteria bacterium]